MSKKKLFVMTALVVILAILGTGTLAYFTTRVITHNVITTGGVDIALEESMIGPDGEEIPFEDQEGVMPGQDVSKIVRVRNDDADAWIRVKVDVTCKGKPVDPLALRIDYNLTDWVRDETDPTIFYYKQIVPAPRNGVPYLTEPLFTEVSLSGANMGNEYQNAEIIVAVQAQGVQVANNGDTVLEAAGWPNFK